MTDAPSGLPEQPRRAYAQTSMKRSPRRARPSQHSLLALLRRSIADERVLAAFAAVSRELFVAPALPAWQNRPLPIGSGQTISQPLLVARMCEALELSGGEHILDVGTGSGYHAALLALLGRSVVSIERVSQAPTSRNGNV